MDEIDWNLEKRNLSTVEDVFLLSLSKKIERSIYILLLENNIATRSITSRVKSWESVVETLKRRKCQNGEKRRLYLRSSSS